MAKGDVAELLADARETYGVFGKAQRALAIVERALVMEPRSVEALNLKAAILYELDRDDEAEACNRLALEAEPCSVEALHGMAALANDRADYPAALQWTDRGLACIPNDPYPEFVENEDYRQRLD